MSSEQIFGASPPSNSPGEGTANYHVEIQRGPVIVGDGNTQINASYITYISTSRATWTDGVAPLPLADETGAMRESPYRGLAAFGEHDAAFFFGRKDAARQVLDRLSQRLSHPGPLIVSGVSGAGKSSLLQAGTLPRIRESGLPNAPEAKDWPFLVLTPSRDPLAGLASIATLAQLDAATTHQALKADPADFALTARQVAEFGPAGTSAPGQAVTGQQGRRLVLIVDQFEQLFTQCPDEDKRVAFLAALQAAATIGQGADNRPAALVVLVVRADFEARCASYPQLAEAVQDRYLVTAMTERQLRMAITEPAKKVGLRVDEDLITILCDDIRGQAPGMAAAGPVLGMAAPAGTLPLLSHVLDTAWRARVGCGLTVADYESVGGIERAVAESAQRAYRGLTAAQQAMARTIFLRLTATSPDGTITADRATRADLLRGKEATQARDVDTVLETFAKERLLTLAVDTVEISHEVLLRAWPLLRDRWLAGSQADRIVRTRLRAAAAEWETSDRDPSYLYAGSLLRDAVAIMASANRARHPEPSPLEQEFLKASNRARRRTTTARRRTIAVLLSLAIGLAATVGFAYRASQDAIRQSDAAIAGQLVTESEAQAATNPIASKIESLAAWQIDPTPQSRYALVSAATRPVPGALAGYYDPLDDPDYSISFSYDRKMMVAIDDDGTAQLWNAITQQRIGHPIRVSGIQGGIASVALSPDGRVVATGDNDGTVRLWNAATQQQLGHPLTVPGAATGNITSVAFSPDGRIVAAGGLNAVVLLWNVATQRHIGHPLPVSPRGAIASVAFSLDGRTLAAGDDRGVSVWSVATQQEIGTGLTVNNNGVEVVALSPDGRTLAIGATDGAVFLWNLVTYQQIGRPIAASATGGVIAVAFSPDGQTLAVGGEDDTVRLLNVATQGLIGQPLSFSTASYPGFYTVAFSPDGRTIGVGIQDGMTWQWNMTAAHGLNSIPLTTRIVVGQSSTEFSSDGQTLVAVADNGTVRLWNVAAQHLIGHPIANGAYAGTTFAVAISPDGRTLATGGADLTTADADGTVRLWNAATQRQIGPALTAGADAGVDVMAFSPNGQTLVVGSQNFNIDNGGNMVRLWNVATHRQIGHAFTVGGDILLDAAAFSPNGRVLATGYDDGTVRLWNTATQRQIGRPITIAAVADYPDAVAFSPDGQTLATGYSDGTVRLWNVATHRQVGQALTAGTNTTVDAVAFSPDGRTLASGSRGGTVWLWDVVTQQEIGQPLAISRGINAVTFRPNGRTLAVASAGGIGLWDTTPIAHPLLEVCQQIGGSLTRGEWKQHVPSGPAYRDPCP
jgi:WD40 repeat protein